MAEIKSESVADFIPESVAGLLRNQRIVLGERAASFHRAQSRYAEATGDSSMLT